MRSDWDDQHGKHVDVQKRYPQINEDEWKYLLNLCAADYVEGLTDPSDARLRWQAELIVKIEARLGT